MACKMNALRAALLIVASCVPASAMCNAQIVIEWNEQAYDSAFGEDQFLTFKGHRAHAMMHLAQDAALRRIDARRAAPGAAAAQAAHDVLLSQYPRDRRAIDTLLERQLAQLPRGAHREAGRALGRRLAQSILEARTGDNIDREGTYRFRNAPGAYQTTPDWNGFVAFPALGEARPFVLRSGNQFRAVPPPALTSAAYASALDEVKRVGAANSAARTADQTGYAVWWMEFPEGSVNRLARELVASKHMDLRDAARLFALLNVSFIDTYIAVWDSKFHFNRWRPRTAIREAARDGNSSTLPDPEWESLRPAPPTPDYVSAHAGGCASAFRVLQEFFPDHGAFTMDSKTAPPGMPTRTFRSFRAAAHECADSRVRLGFHFRYATGAGERLGREIAEYVIAMRSYR